MALVDAGGLVKPPLPSSLSQAERDALPSERVAGAAFFIFGAMVLLPWNCYLSSLTYLDQHAFEGLDWARVSTQVSQTSLLLVMTFTIWKGDALTPRSEYLVPISLVVPLSLLFLASACSGGDRRARLAASLVLTALFMSAVALFQSAVMRVASQSILHYPRLVGQVFLGMAVAGIGTGVVALLVQGLGPADAAAAAEAAYVALFLGLMLMALVTLALQGTYRAVRAYGCAASLERAPSSAEMDTMSLPVLDGSCAELEAVGPRGHSAPANDWSKLRSARAGLVYETAIVAIFLMTFLVFPGVASRWKGRGPIGQYLTAVVSCFQVADTLGRWAADALPEWWALGEPFKLWLLVLGRGACLPFFLWCAEDQASLLGTQAFQLTLMFFFALTNGLASSLAFQYAPRFVPEPARGTVGAVMSWGLTLGIAGGSWLARLL